MRFNGPEFPTQAIEVTPDFRLVPVQDEDIGVRVVSGLMTQKEINRPATRNPPTGRERVHQVGGLRN
jgi:hypothetical protein